MQIIILLSLTKEYAFYYSYKQKNFKIPPVMFKKENLQISQ